MNQVFSLKNKTLKKNPEKSSNSVAQEKWGSCIIRIENHENAVFLKRLGNRLIIYEAFLILAMYMISRLYENISNTK